MTVSNGSDSHSPSHPLRGLLIAQFCGAFNDNAWKLMVALLAIRQLVSITAPGPDFETASQTQTTLAFVVFTFPLALVSTVAGLLADRVSKRSVIILMKSVEVLLMSAATVALWINPAGGILPLIVLGGMGIHSALFSPAKYGILAELLPHERLAAGNGQLEMWTFAAILTGTAAPGILLSVTGEKNARCCGTGENGGEGPHLQLSVARCQPFMWQQFGKNPVFRRTKEGAVNSHAAQHDQRQDASGGIDPECYGGGAHQQHLHRFHQNDDATFADTVGQQTGNGRNQGKWECEHDEG